MCEEYVIPFLFGSFFTVCHPYIDVHFLKCFFCYFSNLTDTTSLRAVDGRLHNYKEGFGYESGQLQV